MTLEVTRYIKKTVERELWARAAGRCQFNGCNRLLYKSQVTQEPVNVSEKAHIYSFSEKGPRSWGPFKRQPENLNDISNLMLMCHDCHKTIDQDKEGIEYSATLLQLWKQEHEQRVVLVTGIASDKKSHVVFYGSNIGEQTSPIQRVDAIEAMFPNRYPAEENPIKLSMTCSHQDDNSGFWNTESTHLNRAFAKTVQFHIDEQSPAHFSLFALAPIPLLIQLGTLFTDKIDVDTYQLIREPKTWKWQKFPEGFEFKINKPPTYENPPALILSLSGRVAHERIKSVLGKEVSIWELTVSEKFIGNDFMRSKAQLSLLRTAIRKIMVEVNDKHGSDARLSIFPAIPISCAIEMGRARMPKADMPWVIYDQNRKVSKFIKAITIGDPA